MSSRRSLTSTCDHVQLQLVQHALINASVKLNSVLVGLHAAELTSIDGFIAYKFVNTLDGASKNVVLLMDTRNWRLGAVHTHVCKF